MINMTFYSFSYHQFVAHMATKKKLFKINKHEIQCCYISTNTNCVQSTSKDGIII